MKKKLTYRLLRLVRTLKDGGSNEYQEVGSGLLFWEDRTIESRGTDREGVLYVGKKPTCILAVGRFKYVPTASKGQIKKWNQPRVRKTPESITTTAAEWFESLNSDWQMTCTAKHAEKELTAFKFEGPGWYITETETMIVIPTHRNRDEIWHQASKDPNEHFTFYVYAGRFPSWLIGALSHAPTRVDNLED